MSQLSSFAPYPPSSPGPVLAVTATAQNLATVDSSGRCTAFRFANVGTQVVYFTFAAQGNALTPATTSNGIPIQPGSVETFTLPPNPQISAIAPTTGSTLTVTPGEGI
jgi:hypothetical protein